MAQTNGIVTKQWQQIVTLCLNPPLKNAKRGALNIIIVAIRAEWSIRDSCISSSYHRISHATKLEYPKDKQLIKYFSKFFLKEKAHLVQMLINYEMKAFKNEIRKKKYEVEKIPA